jgi:branched-chain amino acid transport system permease protein
VASLRPITKRYWGWAALALVLVALPFITGPYYLHLALATVMYGVLALSWDVLARTGQLSLAHSGFFGLGAYASAIIFTRFHVPAVTSIILAGAVAAVVALGLGLLTLRLHGIYTAVATLAFGEVLRTIALQTPGLTGGAMGVQVPPLFGGDRVRAYFLILAVLATAVLFSEWVARSRLRLAFEATRQRPLLAEVMGVDTVRYKVLAFGATSVFPAVAGAFYLHYITVTIPYEAFSINVAVHSVVMSVFGGLHTTVGPLLGTFVLKVAEEFLRVNIPYGYSIIYGFILVSAVLFMPRGLLGVVRSWRPSWPRKRSASASAD